MPRYKLVRFHRTNTFFHGLHRVDGTRSMFEGEVVVNYRGQIFVASRGGYAEVIHVCLYACRA
jgi:hypothetical protein